LWPAFLLAGGPAAVFFGRLFLASFPGGFFPASFSGGGVFPAGLLPELPPAHKMGAKIAQRREKSRRWGENGGKFRNYADFCYPG